MSFNRKDFINEKDDFISSDESDDEIEQSYVKYVDAIDNCQNIYFQLKNYCDDESVPELMKNINFDSLYEFIYSRVKVID